MPGLVLHGVVEEGELPGMAAARPSSGSRTSTCKRPPRHVPLDLGEVVLGDREVRVDRVEPLDGEQGAVVRGHDVADVDEPLARAAVDGRPDLRVLEVEVRGLDRCLALPDLRLGHLDGVSPHFKLLLRDRSRPDKFIGPRQLGFGEVQGSPRLGDGRLGGVVVCLEGPGVDGEERIARMYLGTVREVDFRYAPRHLGLHRHHLARDTLSEGVEVDRNVPGHGLGNRDGRRWALERRWVALRARGEDEPERYPPPPGLREAFGISATPCHRWLFGS